MNGWKLQASELERASGEAAMGACRPWPKGPGLVIGSGGSTGGRKWCLLSWQNLEQSAASTGRWLTAIGIDPSRVRMVNPLSPDHIGGLMPQVRSQHWEAPLLAISPSELKCPKSLLQRSAELTADGREALISLVPTQLKRLLETPAGIQWLRLFRLMPLLSSDPITREQPTNLEELLSMVRSSPFDLQYSLHKFCPLFFSACNCVCSDNLC